MPKLSEVLDQQSGKAGKAASPIEGGSMPIFTPGGQGVIEGPTNRPIGEAPSGAVDKNGNVINTSGRVGDYVYSQGRAYVVPNSMTDLWQRYGVVRGSSAPQDFKITDFANAAVDAFTAYMGLPTNTDNLINTAVTGAAGQLLKGSPATRSIWAVANAMDSLLKAKNQYLKDWADQEVDYDIALDFSLDKDGNTIATVNYDKMKDAGYGSGRDVLKATNTENSDVSLVDDNNIRVDVSDTFAHSDLYADTLKQIKDAYPILTTEMANMVVNEDTGATVLDTIKSFILSQEAQYYYNAKSIYDFKQVAPNASAESLQKATYTQLMGAMDQKTLKEMTVTVYNEKNEVEEKNAEEYLNSIKAMDKKARENYMSSIGNRILSDDISDDEKAILQAQSNALYMASNNDGEYKDMYRKDFGDAVADSRTLLLGLRVGSLFGIDELTTFQENELFRAGLDVTTGLARVLASSKIMNGLERLERMGLQQLGSKIGDNAVGNFLSNINKYAPQDSPIRITDIGKTAPNGTALTFGGWVGRTMTQQIAQLGADAMFDFTKMGAYAMAGEDYDFWDELSTDFLIDALMTWGPNAYVEAMTTPKYERKWVKLSADEYKKEKKALEDIDKRMEEDEFFDGKYQGVTGEGMYELRYVELTADELAKRHAERLQKLTDSKLGMKVQELFGDRNAALGKLALQVRKVVTGDTYYFRKMVNASNDIRQLTADTVNEYMARETTSKLFSEYKTVLKDITKSGKMGEVDRNYINAVLQRDRWLAMFKGDKKAEKDIHAEYDKYIENMAPERAEQLDRLIAAMRPIAADGMNFYVERGILSKKQLKDMRNDPVYKDGKYFPVWKKGSPRGDIEIPQGRAKVKSIFDPKVLISVNDLESPIVTLGSYINNIARNVAMNDRNLTIREIASIPGIDIHITEDTGGALSDVTNLREVSEKFEKQYQKIVAEVKASVPTRKQWQKINDELILKSVSMKRAGELEALKAESKELKKQLKKLKAEQGKALEIAEAQKENRAIDLIELENKIDANKRAQLRAMDDIKTHAQRLMEKAQAINKGAPAKLDIQSYVDVQLTNNLKKAFKAKNTTAEIQAVLNKAVEEANPYISRSQVIAARTEEAAYKFRKRAARDIKVKENVYGKKKADIVNDVIDKVTDFVVTKATGERATLKAIDDNELTRILNNHDGPHTISYLLDGVEHKMTLTGKGSEALVRELKSPEARTKTGLRRILNFGNKIAQAKRYLTTSSDPTRVLPNLARDWSRGIITTGGNILLSPDKLRTDAIESGRYTPEQIEKIDNGFRLASQAIEESTFTASMQLPKKNREKAMVRALTANDGNAFTRFVYDRTENAGKFFSTLQDMGETFTRKRAMENAYYKELANASARGMNIDDAVKRATEAAYFYGREATVNFFRRGSLIAEIAQQVPYLSQNFASLESFKYAFLDNPIAVTRSLKATVSTYAALIAIALSNDESRKRYFLLTEYDRAHNIIIPLANDLIVTIPLDENVSAFLTPYRRMIETLNGVDPEAFYLWGAESLEALSPLDLSGFSEGDKFNVVRGFQKIGSQVIPTWAQPILESMTGTDWYYGSKISVDEDYIGSRTGNWNPTPGELTTKSKNSEVLAHVANATGIPQWIVQNIYSEYGGNVGQYFLNTLDKLVGSTEEAQGGKNFMDAIFKPLTGADSDEANNAFWTGVNRLSEEKTTLQREIKTLNEKIEAAVGEEKAALQNKRQEKVRAFGTRVSDFLTQYLSAFELTGGLTKSQANRIWRLYDIYDQNENEQLYRSGSPEEYWGKKASSATNKEATNLAGLSGLDTYYHTPIDDYNRTYAEQMFRNTIYGDGAQRMAGIANILEDTSDYENSFTKLRSDAIKLRKEAKTDKDWDNYDRIAYQYDYKVLSAIYPYLIEHGVADTLNNNEVIKYLEDWILVPSSEMRTSKGRYVPNLGVDSEKYKAFTKQFVKKMYGVSGE